MAEPVEWTSDTAERRRASNRERCGVNIMTDPANFVDEFTKQVEDWREWRKRYEAGRTRAGDPFKLRDPFTIKILKDLDEMLTTQDRVNNMMLAALDELRKERE